MTKNWNLYVVGVGGIDAAQDLLPNFVAQLRDAGLKITDANLFVGDVYNDLHSLDSSEQGWTIQLHGTGDPSKAYGQFPGFLQQLEQDDMRLLDSGIIAGTLRNVPVNA